MKYNEYIWTIFITLLSIAVIQKVFSFKISKALFIALHFALFLIISLLSNTFVGYLACIIAFILWLRNEKLLHMKKTLYYSLLTLFFSFVFYIIIQNIF